MVNVIAVDNTLSRFGRRELHLIWMGSKDDGQAADLRPWLEAIPADADDVESHVRYEAEAGIWHAHLYWSARETIHLIVPDQQGGREKIPAVMWKIGERVSWAIDMAATRYRLDNGRWPDKSLMHERPDGGQQVCRVADVSGKADVRIEINKLVPSGFVVVL